ncbi:MAG: TldD/PmbA family protein [Candidatus Heimdallarchaeota archaeon]|nr:TldD/PmbA family protein [Candidatus Heimdallarchaeota archaeon]
MTNIDLGIQILDAVDRSKVQFADIRFYTSEDLNITVRRGKAEDVSSETLEGVAIRALVDGAWGFASVASFEKVKIAQTLDNAISMASGASSIVKRKAVVSNEPAFEGRNEFQPDLNPADLSFEEKFNLAASVEKNLRDYDQRIINSSGSYSEKVQREEVVNTNGTKIEMNDYGVFRLGGSATSRAGDVIQNVSDSVATNAGLKKLVDWNIDEAMGNLGKRAIDLLDSDPSPSGRMNVLLEPSIVGVYIHEAFGHASEGDGVMLKRSVLTDKVGEQVAHPSISVVDDPTIPGLRGSFKYDSEGTVTKARDIVVNGSLTGYLNDLTTATMLETGNEFNGSGRATDFRHMAMPRMGNTFIKNGSMSLDELAEVVGNGVYLQYSMGGYVNPSSGEFFFTSQSGYKIENGEFTRPIRNSGMSGMTLEVLKNTIGLGNDLYMDAFPGTCGKGNLTGYQPMPVTGGGPTLAASEIVVGGR